MLGLMNYSWQLHVFFRDKISKVILKTTSSSNGFSFWSNALDFGGKRVGYGGHWNFLPHCLGIKTTLDLLIRPMDVSSVLSGFLHLRTASASKVAFPPGLSVEIWADLGAWWPAWCPYRSRSSPVRFWGRAGCSRPPCQLTGWLLNKCGGSFAEHSTQRKSSMEKTEVFAQSCLSGTLSSCNGGSCFPRTFCLREAFLFF